MWYYSNTKSGEKFSYENLIILLTTTSSVKHLLSTENPIFYHVKLQDERQLAWDQREVELERQLDQYEKHQKEILSSAGKVNYCLQLLMMKLTASKM